MRTAFIEALYAIAERDERIWLVTGDLGFSVLERFAERFPERYINVGVAEQNMTGIAAGLALSGKVVFTYSIANFPIMRCLEQIRNDVCYHRLPVKIVAVGGGLAYGSAGYTHFAIEDLAVMRALPHMAVVAPGDPAEARSAVEAAVDWEGPCYLRLGKAGEPQVHAEPVPLVLGKALIVRPGQDATLVSTGGMLHTTVAAADLLLSYGIQARVVQMHTLKPLDQEAIVAAAQETRAMVSIEEHTLYGGLGSAVAEVLAERRCVLPFARKGLPELAAYPVGSQRYLLGQLGLSPEQIARTTLELLGTS